MQARDGDAEPAAGLRVFVLGNARSGTSIMWFAIHDAFGLPGTRESHAFPAFTRMIAAFEKSELRRRPTLLASRLTSEHARAGLRAMARGFYAEQFPLGSFLDKTPGAESLQAAELIEDVFPEARLVVMKRTGVEAVDSFRKKFKAEFEQACGAWARGMTALAEVRGRLRNALLVDQYDLTNDALATSRRICEHLGDGARAERLAAYFRENSQDKLSTHERTRRLTLADMAWSAEEKALFAATCGAAMEAWGYPL